jgi:hypothetical protein
MRRQHVVVRGDYGQVAAQSVAQRVLVVCAAGGKAVRQVAAGKMRALRAAAIHRIDALQIGGTRIAAAFAQAFGDFGNHGVQRVHGKTPEQVMR